MMGFFGALDENGQLYGEYDYMPDPRGFFDKYILEDYLIEAYLNNAEDGDMRYYNSYRFYNNLGALITSDYYCNKFDCYLILFNTQDDNIHARLKFVDYNKSFNSMNLFLYATLEYSKTYEI